MSMDKSSSISTKEKQMNIEIKKFKEHLNNIKTNNLIQYHNYLRNRLKIHYQEDGTTDNEKRILEKFDSLLNINTFLMIYSFLEGDLYQIAIFNNIEVDNSNNSIRKYEPLINSFGEQSLSETNNWNVIRSAKIIRDTLLHCDGIIEASRDKKCIELLLASPKSKIKSIEGKLNLTPEYLDDFVKAVKAIKTHVVRTSKK